MTIKEIIENPKSEDPVTHEIKEYPLMLQLEIENRLDEDTKIDLQFGKGFNEYNQMFSRKFGFSNEQEMNLIKGILDTIRQYELANQIYVIQETLNNYLYIKNLTTNAESYINMKSPQITKYVKEILQWVGEQDRYVHPGV